MIRRQSICNNRTSVSLKLIIIYETLDASELTYNLDPYFENTYSIKFTNPNKFLTSVSAQKQFKKQYLNLKVTGIKSAY